jgi:hypothetical protein
MLRSREKQEGGSDQGEGFDARTVPDPLAAGNLEAEHGRGIPLMKSALDLVSLQGWEAHMQEAAS